MSSGIQATSAVKADFPNKRVKLTNGVKDAKDAGLHARKDSVYGAAAAPMELEEHPVENFRRMRVIVIGAGFSGIYCGIKIPEWLRNVDLTIYEKNEGVGGTWWENRYPGKGYLLYVKGGLKTLTTRQAAHATYLHIHTYILSNQIHIGATFMHPRPKYNGIWRASRRSILSTDSSNVTTK